MGSIITDWLIPGYHILKLPDLGEVHLEILEKADDESGFPLWEALVYCREGGGGPWCTVLHIIEESWEALCHQIENALPQIAQAE